jgi:uncharacterized protein with HEPN domain
LRDDGVYLEYIEESIERIEQYLAGASGAPDRERFSTDDVTQDAVLRRLETLAEATSHLSSELRERYPTIDWRKVANFRNVLARGYVELSLDLIWQAITEDLPKLKAVIARERLT